MNHIYKNIWSKSLGRIVVVAENAKSAGKQTTTVGTTQDIGTEQPLSLLTATVKTLVFSISLCTGMSVWAGTVCDGDATLADGQNLNSAANGTNAFACGSNNTASGGDSSALGHKNIASGGASTAVGYSNIASGGESIAVGFEGTVANRKLGRHFLG